MLARPSRPCRRHLTPLATVCARAADCLHCAKMGFSSPDIAGAAIFASGAALLVYAAKRKAAMLPNKEEQAWLDAQMQTPAHLKLSDEENKWLDKQVQDAEDQEMLDDARQAGACTPSR